MIHESVVGQKIENTADPHPQLVNFTMMVSAMGDHTLYERTMGLSFTVLGKVLSYFRTKIKLFQSFANTWNRYLSVVAYSPLIQETSDASSYMDVIHVSDLDTYGINVDERFREVVARNMGELVRPHEEFFKIGDITALILGLFWPETVPYPTDNRIVEDGWDVCDQLQIVANYIALAKETMPRVMFSKKERLEWAFNQAKVPLAPILKEIVINTSKTFSFPAVGTAAFMKKYQLIREIWPNLSIFGWSDHVYFNASLTNNAEIMKNWKMASIAGRPEERMVANYDRIMEWFEGEVMYQKAAKSIAEAIPIEYRIPFPLTMGPPAPERYLQDLIVLESNKVTIKAIYQDLWWVDDDTKLYSNVLAFRQEPKMWMTDNLAYIPLDSMYIPDLIDVVIVSKNWKIIQKFERLMRTPYETMPR
jgi:hypothetical protein